jgi:hypothetical protein
MAEETTGGNSATAVAEPASGQAAPAVAGTSEPTGQAATPAQSAPTQESFTSIDPSTLPPELQAVYKNLQADYTKKTMSVADVRKKAEAFDKVSSRSDFKDWWTGASKVQKAEFKEQKAEVEKTLGQKITDERFQQAFQTKDGFLELIAEVAKDITGKSQAKIEQLEQKLSVKDAEAVVDQFATEVGQDGKPVRPDFYSLDEDRLISGYLQLSIDPSKGLSSDEYTQKLNEAYGWAKNLSQKYYEKGKAEALQIIQKKAAASSEPPTGGAKGAYTGPNPKNLSVREAMELAKKNIRVPRDD